MVKCLLFNVVEFPYLSRSLGIYRIAHVLREENLDVEVADWSSWWQLDQLKQYFLSRNPDKIKLVGFSHMFSIWTDTLEEFAGWIKTSYPHVEIFSGSSVNPRFKSQYIDYYIQGFGEKATIALTKYLAGNGDRPRFELEKINGAKIIKANDWYPSFPAKSLMVQYQDRDFLQPDEWLTIEFARGCKFSCSFCNFPVIGVKGDYTRDAEDFRQQITDTYDRYGIKNYIVADETFNDRTEKIIKFADVVEQLPFVPWFSGYIRADLMISRKTEKEELLRMNFLGHYYGIESFNTKSAQAVGKGMSGERLKQGLLEARKFFESNKNQLYRGQISLIAGLPYETVDTLNSTKQWLIENWQGQTFSMFELVMPAGEGVKPSKMTMEYKKFGYEIVNESPKFDPNTPVRPGSYGTDDLNWKNPNMDYQQAIDITKEFVAMKQHYDFRPGAFTLGQKLKNVPEVERRVALLQHEFENSRNKDIGSYIEKKLDINTA